MGANAQTTVPTFTSGQVLTAEQQNQSARTGVPVFATTVERDAAFGGSGEKTLAEGQLAYLEDSDVVQYYDGSGWATVGPSADSGLTLVSTTTIGTTVSTVTVTGAFSATYDNYYITVAGGVGSTSANLQLQLGSQTSGYYGGSINVNYSSSAVTGGGDNNAAQFSNVGYVSTIAMGAQIQLNSPNLAKVSLVWAGPLISGSNAGTYQGQDNASTQHTSFIIKPSAGTITGGTIRVYGFANS